MAATLRYRLSEYDASSTSEKLGHLIAGGAAGGFESHRHTQTDAWVAELNLLQTTVHDLITALPVSKDWWLLLEYEIPRRLKRPDAILLADDVIIVIEFKIGGTSYSAIDEWQVQNYALDLRDFHQASLGRRIIPLLVVTNAPDRAAVEPVATGGHEFVWPAQRANKRELSGTIRDLFTGLQHDPARKIDPAGWEHSAYRPTPTIIEAAAQLFAGHGVTNISHAFATNLGATTNEIVRAITSAQAERSRTICFVTGSPGAGKTLAGLNAAHDPHLRTDDRPPAIFLSGNGPLVKIIREALVRDKQREGLSKKEASRVVSTFIANVHSFLTHYGIKERHQVPAEHAIVFDEAQRAWTADAVRKKHSSIGQSEPSMILEIMERAPDWCTVIALVGNGQEIHQGEAGIEEWGRALSARTAKWRVMASPSLLDKSNHTLRIFDAAPAANIQIQASPAFHLTSSVRSPRARLLGEWVDSLLSNQLGAKSVHALDQGRSEFPIAFTRNLQSAREWLRARADPQQRTGMLASSGGLRLRADGVEVSTGFRQGYSYVDWFLAEPEDTRSSTYLEVAATEFECQGLEIDWACVCWGGDFLMGCVADAWECRKFRGTKWQRVRRADQRQYIVNKYRVLLTRARYGMIIWIPAGDSSDPTRDPAQFDATADYLTRTGVHKA